MRKIALLAFAALVLAAGPALASNTGFKLNQEMIAGSNYISLPYFYFADGDVNNPNQTAQLTCCDLDADGMIGTGGRDCSTLTPPGVVGGGDCHVLSVTHFTPAGPFGISCGGLGDFDLTAGEGVIVAVEGACTANIVGSHDDNYSFNKGSSTISVSTTAVNLLSVPYHIVQEDAQALCAFIEEEFGDGVSGPGEYQYIQQLTHFVAGAPFGTTCGGLGTFPITAGEGLFMDVLQPMDIQFETY